LPLLPVILMLALGIALWLARNRSERAVWAISVAGQFLVWLVILAIHRYIPSRLSVSVWRPTQLFGTPLVLSLDATGWAMDFGIATLLLSIGLTSASRRGSATPATRVFIYAYGALAMMAVMAGNLLTLAIVWAMTEVIAFSTSLILVARKDIIPREIVRLGVQGTSVVLVLAAAVLLGNRTSSGDPTMVIWAYVFGVTAAAFRLGLIPAHYPLPSLPGIRRGLGTCLRVLPAAMGMVLLVRLLASRPPIEVTTALAWIGGVGALIGGLSWTLHLDAVERRPMLVLGLAAAALCGAALSHDRAPAVALAGAGSLILVAGMVSLAEPHEIWHKWWALAATFMILGGPFTPGQTVVQAVLNGGGASGSLVPAALGLLGIVLLALGVLRQTGLETTPWASGEDLVRVSYVSGFLILVAAGAGMSIVAQTGSSLRSLAAFTALSGASALAYFGYTRFGRPLGLFFGGMTSSVGKPVLPEDLGGRLALPLKGLVWIGDLLQGDAGLLWVSFLLLVLAAMVGSAS
jgi:hypothetical protein